MTQPPIQPDPSFIAGGVAKTPFVLQHDPVALFTTRATRFRFLAQSSDLAAYLEFLADLAEMQARLAGQLPPPEPVDAAQQAQATQATLPLINRANLADRTGLHDYVIALCAEADALSMPDVARQALDAVRSANVGERRQMLANILNDSVPADSVAPHLFVAAAVQMYMARLAASLPADALKPVSTGVCPACGGKPVTSSVLGLRDIENVRYATCSCCATQWNEVRITCLCCGSTKGISYRSVDTKDATVKAEVCTECDHWVKILYQVRNASLDPVADDVGSVGLDILMRNETDFTRGGFNPFLAGY